MDMEDQAKQPETKPETDLPEPENSSKKIIIIGIAVIVFLLLLAGAYVLFFKNSSSSQTKTNQQSNNSSQANSQNSQATGTKHYDSKLTGLDLSLDYPDNWTLNDTVKDSKDPTIKYITIESPNVSIDNADGKQTNGKVVVMIRPRGSDIAELRDSNSSVAQDSQQIGYKNPSPTQHQYPYITFVHFGSNRTSKNPFEEVLITGSNKFTSGQLISDADVSGIDPLVSASFFVCANEECAAAGNNKLSIADSTWQNDPTMQQTKAIFESLVIK